MINAASMIFTSAENEMNTSSPYRTSNEAIMSPTNTKTPYTQNFYEHFEWGVEIESGLPKEASEMSERRKLIYLSSLSVKHRVASQRRREAESSSHPSKTYP